MSIQLRDGLASQSVDLVLEDLLVRFLVNVPDEDLSSIERVFFQVEEAQWFYTDFVRQLDPTLPGMKMKQFSTRLLEKCPLIWKWGDPSDAISRFGKYKSTIPVRGVALFNKDLTKMILVKGTESNTWSFPRGKISKDETDLECALREVEEETGFNARDYIDESDVVERTIKGKNYKIYLAKNVPEDYNFQPLARNEIASIEWHDIKQMQKKIRTNPQKYFIVATVMKPLTRWINKNKGVLNEEELMLKAEIKLKALLGINQPKKENVDAGRELLNLLQGVAPSMESKPPSTTADSGSSNFAGEQYVNMTLPQHIHNQLPFFNNTAINFPQAFPINNQAFFFPPTAPIPPIAHSNHPGLGLPGHQASQHLPNQAPTQTRSIPNPNQPHVTQQQAPIPTHSSNRRSSEANSKELLSILNRKPAENKSSHKPELELSEAQAAEINRTKADKLLNLFHNKTKQENESFQKQNSSESFLSASDYKKSYLNRQHEPSNELEKSLQSSHDFSEPGKKLRILKRPESYQDSGDASAEILNMLGRPPTSSEPSSKESSTEPKERRYSNELLDLLKRNKPTPSVKPIKEEDDILHENKTATNDLLGLLNQGQDSSVASRKPEASSLNQNESSGQDFQDFENFEDFEDFDNMEPFEPSQNQNDLFDIASDDEDLNHHSRKATSKKPFTPNHVPHQEPKPSTQQQQAPSFKSEHHKRPIRILKPGESLSEVLGTKAPTPNQVNPSANLEKSSADDSKSLLSLLNGGKPPTGNENNGTIDYSAIYGSPSSNSPGQPAISARSLSQFSAPQAPYPTDEIPKVPESAHNPGGSLLDLLGRKPPSKQEPSMYEQLPIQNQASQRRPLTLDDLESRQTSGFPSTTNPAVQNAGLGNDSHSSAKDLLNILKGGLTSNDSASSFHSASSQL